jgi:eukaryotic-like serine/threonine-protein kinase
MTLDRGTFLNGRYRIVDILGQGGMASVYRAIDDNLGVEVAVKENLFTTEEYARQFRLEATILANLRHPNMPRVTDHFVIDGQGQYLVMDYIEGEDLRQRMDRLGNIPEEEVIVIGLAICEALNYLHARTPLVLHRDIKPGNVKIDPSGKIFLVDFGLAKIVHGGQATTTGARAMTPGYSPPEQYGTARTDHRTDIYSLGATLYSALTDILPEDGLSRAMEQAGLTPVREHNSNVSKRLASAVEKSLEVLPDDRYQSAEEFRRALLNARSTTRRKTPVELLLTPPPQWGADGEEIGAQAVRLKEAQESLEDNQGDEGLSQHPDPDGSVLPHARKAYFLSKKQKRRRILLSLVVVGVFLTLFGAGIYSQSDAFPGKSLTAAFGWQTASQTPDGSQVTDSNGQLVNTPVSERPTLTHTASPTQTSTSTPAPTATVTRTSSPTPQPTPMGGGLGQIAFASDREGSPDIWLMDLDGDNLSRLTFIPEGACQPAWSPDGSRLVFISPCSGNQDHYPGSSLFLINADGSDLTPIPSAPGGDFDPAWSPDGKYIAFASLRNNNYPQIHILEVDTNVATLIPDPENRTNFQPAWSPDGKQLTFVGPRNQIWVMDIDGSNVYLLSRPSDFFNRYPIWSPTGDTIVFTQWTERGISAPWLATSPVEPGSVTVVISKDYAMAEASFSPDGFWLTYKGWNEDSNRDIYIMTKNGVNRQRLTYDPANDFDPAWRPGNLP